MVAMDQPVPASLRERNLRFGLRSLMIAMALVAAWLAYASYHQPLTSEVTYRFALIDAASLEPLVRRKQDLAADGSSYSCVVLDDSELAQAFKLNGQDAPLLGEDSRTISSWPCIAVTYHYSRPTRLKLAEDHYHSDWETGTLAGFLGSRRSGMRPQLRVECDVTYSRPASEHSEVFKEGRQTLVGDLFYEGNRPRGHLLFFKSFDDNTLHCVVVTAK